MGWQPSDGDASVAYLEATDYEGTIPLYSGQVVDILWRKLEELVAPETGWETVRSKRAARILRLLEDSGNPSNRQNLIALIFGYPKAFADLSIAIPPWFGVYTERLQVVAEVFRPVWKSEYSTAFDNDGYDYHYRWDTRPLHQVMEFLCASRNPISTNLLIQVAQFPKIEVAEMVSDRGECPPPHELEGVVSARERAGSELRRRGHPLYHPDAYQVECYWHDAAPEPTVQASGKIGGVQAAEPTGRARQGSDSGMHPGLRDLKAEDAGAVETLIRSLKDGDSKERSTAAEALGRMGDARAVELLTETLKDSHWRVRQAAAQALEELGWNPGADETGAWYWLAKRDLVRCAQLGPLAVEPLLAALGDDDWRLRQFAAHRLGNLGDARAVEGLIAALEDSDLRVREAATEALGKMATAVEPLIAALQVRNWQVREAATRALGALGDTRAVEPLTLALKESQSSLRVAAARALGKIRDAQAVEALIGILNDGHADVRHAAAEALAALGWKPGDGPGWLPPATKADR